MDSWPIGGLQQYAGRSAGLETSSTPGSAWSSAAAAFAPTPRLSTTLNDSGRAAAEMPTRPRSDSVRGLEGRLDRGGLLG